MELKQINSFGKARCSCCGYFTISNVADTCPVCYWEENIYQEENKNDEDAPNYISLIKAQINFRLYGAKKEEFKDCTRKPYNNEKSE